MKLFLLYNGFSPIFVDEAIMPRKVLDMSSGDIGWLPSKNDALSKSLQFFPHPRCIKAYVKIIVASTTLGVEPIYRIRFSFVMSFSFCD